MILLLGSSGYLGRAFQTILDQRGEKYTTLPRSEANHTRFSSLTEWLRVHQPEFVINAAGYTGKPNVDACEKARGETLDGNVLWPIALAHACSLLEIPFGHVSSGCLYNGAYLNGAHGWNVETDLTQDVVGEIINRSPNMIRGFSEDDAPNFTFRQSKCSFYSGSKALAEEAIADLGECYLWRPRLPFDHFDHPKNYLSKLLRYEKLYSNVNSLSHRMDFANACLDCWKQRVPFGIYHVTNPGYVTTSEVVERIQEILRPDKAFAFWKNDLEFYTHAAAAARSNCILETNKLIEAGVQMRPVRAALEEALRFWKPEHLH